MNALALKFEQELVEPQADGEERESCERAVAGRSGRSEWPRSGRCP